MNRLLRQGITIAASVSCFNLFNIESQMRAIEESGVKLLHFDVVDGSFNDCFILGTPTLRAIRPHTAMPIEVHLGVWEPERYIGQFISAGADYISVHYEALKSNARAKSVFDSIRKQGAEPVLALKAETGCDKGLFPLLREVDWVLKLLVNPGYSGQGMQMSAVTKMHEVRAAIEELGLRTGLEADGNINVSTIPLVVKAGANILTGGSSGLFTADGDVASNVRRMLDAACPESLNN